MVQTRQHTTEIVLPASPQEVWSALTETSQVRTWYAPEARVDARTGGEYFVSWGRGMEAAATIEIFEPNRRLRIVSERNGARMAIDFSLEPTRDGVMLCLVHSGFPDSPDWNDEYNGTKLGWPIMLRILRYGLTHHPGESGRQRWLYTTAALSPGMAWRRFAEIFHGVTPEYSAEPWEFCTAWSEPAGGLVYASFTESKGLTSVSLHVVLYGGGAARIEEAAADWKLRLDALYA